MLKKSLRLSCLNINLTNSLAYNILNQYHKCNLKPLKKMNFFQKILNSIFANPLQPQIDAAKANGDRFYISGGDFDMNLIFSGKTKEEAIEKAYQTLKGDSPDILLAYKDQTSDPVEQDKMFRSSLEFLVDEIK